jgi:alpha-L-rhamnosidase
MEVKPQNIITTPSGKKVLDFGQNLVGWLRIERDIPGNGDLLIRHAEVMEHGELGTRPLRTAKQQTLVKLGGGSTKGYEPRFTFYGFRYRCPVLPTLTPSRQTSLGHVKWES